MGAFKEYNAYDALGLGELVKNKEITPVELLDEAVCRIDDLNPDLNAVITPMYEIAREAANGVLPGGAFQGVPFLIKDIVTSYKGVRLSNGCRAYRNYIPDYDSEMVTRFKKTGMLICGKTNTPEFGLLGITEPELFGPSRNPWNRNHTPGGSSGGSASAVAAGMVPMASGNDGGGSIRIPASCCGLFGLKPSRGRNPSGPVYGRLWQGAASEGVLSRSVRDSAAALDYTHGPDAGAPFTIIPPKRSYLEEVTRKAGNLRIAMCTESPIGTEVHPECVKAVQNTAKLLESLGHVVEEAKPGVDGEQMARSYFVMYYGTVATEIRRIQSIMGRKPKRKDVELQTRIMGLLGRTYSAGDFVEAMNQWDRIGRIMGSFHGRYDVYVTPTIAFPPLKIGALAPGSFELMVMKLINRLGLGKLIVASGLVNKIAIESLSKTPFTQLANMTGQPAMSVPLHWTDDNLPVGVQFVAPFGDESTLFRLAGQLERACPWFDRRP